MERYLRRKRLGGVLDEMGLRALIALGTVMWFVWLWGLGMPALLAGLALGLMGQMALTRWRRRAVEKRERALRRQLGGEMLLEDMLLQPPRRAHFQAAMLLGQRYPLRMERVTEDGMLCLSGEERLLVSCLLSLRFLLRVEDDFRVRLRDIRLHGRMALRIIRVGLPTGIQNMVISFSNVLVQASVNSYGAAAMAGFAAYMKIDGFNILPVSSISMAATTFVGQNYGAGRLDRVKRSVWVTLAIGVLYTLCTGAALLAGQDAILHLFTADEAVVTYGKLAMRWFCPFYFLLSILHGLAGAVRGTGASIPPMVVLLVSLCLFRVVWIQFLLPFFSGIEGVFILYPVSWGLGAVLMILYAWKGKWMEYHT